ncbi:MAG: STAS domain-containing protein [Magnetococcales bacterium]|nr:STAS domain-containing protein [Magnetococcales bacterium]
MSGHKKVDEEYNQQILKKMTQEELVNAVDKDFIAIWNSNESGDYDAADNADTKEPKLKFPTSINADGSFLIAVTTEKFSFECNGELHNTFDELPQGERYIVDFKKVKYIDSSGMGLLLLLREHHGNFDIPIKIINCCDTVLQLLKFANFGQMFEIS